MDRDTVAEVTSASSAPTADQAFDLPGPAANRRVHVVLCLSLFLAVINFAAPAPFFPAIARDLRTTVPLLGQVTTALTLLSTVLGLGIGPLADRHGYRRLLVGGVVAIAINLLGTGLAPTYPTLLLLAVVGALGDAILFGLPMAIASTRFAGAARRRAVGWTSAGLPIGTVAGVPLLTAAGAFFGWRTVLVGCGLATLGAAFLAAAWLPADPPTEAGRIRPAALVSSYLPLLRHRPLLVLYAVSGLRAASWVGMLTYLGAFLAAAFGFGPSRIGLGYMATGVGVFLGSLAAAGRLSRILPRPLVAVGTVAQGLLFGAVFVLPLSPAAALALLPPAAFGGAVAFVGVAALLADETPGGAATTMVLNGSVFNFGTAAGAALGGLLVAGGGYGALGLGLPVFALVAGLLVLLPAGPRRVPAR